MPNAAWVNLAGGKGEPEYAALGREFRASKMTFILHVPSWLAYTPLQTLDWKQVKYDSASFPDDSRGVYAFVLDSSQLAPGMFPPHAMVFYVGETGDQGNATLKSRLQNYRNKKAQRDRARLWAVLETWGEYLLFYYAVVAPGVSTKACETTLLDALVPPANKKDFSAKVRLAREAAFNE